ncbi:MAG: hypothetical protein J6X53_03975, partial [Abditibacteriota bacterium]|nr:hypothetical protein [Abditibacteriota bacterium]
NSSAPSLQTGEGDFCGAGLLLEGASSKNSRQSVRKWEKFPLCGVDFLSRLCYNIPRSKEMTAQYGA